MDLREESQWQSKAVMVIMDFGNQNIIETAKSETNFIKSQAMANSPKLCHTHTRFLDIGEQRILAMARKSEAMR